MRLFHFTCDHGFEGITRTGFVRPGADGLVWLTDLAEPKRKHLGLTSVILACDRMGHRIEVEPSGEILSYRVFKQTLSKVTVRGLETPGSRPSNWYVSRTPLPIVGGGT